MWTIQVIFIPLLTKQPVDDPVKNSVTADCTETDCSFAPKAKSTETALSYPDWYQLTEPQTYCNIMIDSIRIRLWIIQCSQFVLSFISRSEPRYGSEWYESFVADEFNKYSWPDYSGFGSPRPSRIVPFEHVPKAQYTFQHSQILRTAAYVTNKGERQRAMFPVNMNAPSMFPCNQSVYRL